ncbi:MAG: glycosyltransferase [Eubacteriales bacterium]
MKANREIKKVIFVIVNMSGGGAERVISILANQFVKTGMEVAIMMTAGSTVSYKLDERIELICVGQVTNGSMGERIKRVKNMRKYFKKNKEATIISFGPGTSFFAMLADLGLPNPRVISERNDPAICPYPFFRNIIYNMAHVLVFQTEDARDCFPKRIAKKGYIIPNPIKEELPSPFVGVRKKKIVAVGRLEEQKNYPLLIKVFATFVERFPEYELHIYGEGSLREKLEMQIKESNMEKQIILKGFVKSVLEEIIDASMYVLSSDYEGISNALLEAMAIGLPVVSTDCPIGGSKLCIQHGENGLLVPVGDGYQMLLKMKKIASNQTFADEISKNAAQIKEKYSEKNISEMWKHVMMKI